MATMMSRPARGAAYCVACVVAILTARAPAADAIQAPPQVHPKLWPKLRPGLARDAALEARLDTLLARMTPEQKVGQLIQADIGSITPDDLRHYPLGSILNGGNSSPRDDKLAAPSEWLKLADRFYAASLDTPGSPGIPVLWGTDAVHGHNNIPGATIFPHNIGLGAARDPELIRRIAAVTALEVRVTGLDWAFSPTVAVARDARWGRTYESYSESPELVRRYAAAMVTGLQGKAGHPAIPGRRSRAGDAQALPRRRRHRRPRSGGQPGQRAAAARAGRGRLRGGHPGRRPDRHGLLLELAGPQDARQL